MKKIEKIESLSLILIKARESQNKSQRWMAKALGKSPTTISNWEEGISIPNIIEMLEWFDVLGINPAQYMLAFIDPNLNKNSNVNDTETSKNNLIEFIQNVATPETINKLAFNLLGDTGSFFEAQIDLITAHNLCNLDIRVSNAWLIYHNYIMAKNREELLLYDIKPDEQVLFNAITNGEQAAFDKKNGYVTYKKTTEK